MFERHVQQLKSSDSTQRREAIVALGKSGDPRAVGHLVRASKTDPDPALRALAARAERDLQKPQNQQEPERVIQPLPPRAAQPVVPARVVSAVISDQDKRQAKEYLNRALNHRLRGENKDAVAELAKAVKLDPGLAADPGAVHLAIDLTGASADEAISEVIEKDREWEVRRHRTPLTRESQFFLLEMVILFVILASVLATVSGGFIRAINTLTDRSPTPVAVYHVLQSSFTGIQPANIPVAAFTALLMMVTLLITNGIKYTVGVALGGTANAVHFLRVMMRLQILVYLAIIVLQILIVLPALASQDSFESSMYNLIWLSVSVSGIGLLGLLVAECITAGRMQGFGFIRGFMNVIMGNIVFACIWVSIGWLTLRH